MPSNELPPEDVDAAFAEIIADLKADGFDSVLSDVKDKPSPTTAPTPWRAPSKDMVFPNDLVLPEPDDEGHYEPGEPPPLPRPKWSTIVALALIVVGLFLIFAPNLIGLGQSSALPIAFICVIVAIALLVWRMRSGPPPDSSHPNGAQI